MRAQRRAVLAPGRLHDVGLMVVKRCCGGGSVDDGKRASRGKHYLVYKTRYGGLRYGRPVRNVLATHLTNTLQIQQLVDGQGRSAPLKRLG